MPYRFKPQEPLQDGVRRIAREQLGRAVAGFAPDKPRDAAIHDARRRLKKVRALLRLVRPALGDKAFRHLNWALRDAGMLLSGARDLFVMEGTLNTLESHAPARAKTALSAARRVVDEIKGNTLAESDAAAVDEGVAGIRAILLSVADLNCADLDISDLTRGFRSCYADCRKAFHQAAEVESDDAFHEWRKTAQRHWRQVILMRAAWPAFFDARAELAEELSGLLGEDHDLAILKTFAAAHIGKGLTPKQSETIFNLAQSRQDFLRARSKWLAATLLAVSPKSLAKEAKAYWAAALAVKPIDLRKEPEEQKASRKSVGNGADDVSGPDADESATPLKALLT